MVLKEIRALRKDGRVDAALERLRVLLAEGSVPAEKLEAAGRMLSELLASAGAPKPAHRLLLLGQNTTSFLRHTLAAVAHAQGVLLDVEEGGYDSVLQELAAREERRDVVIVLPWHQRLLSDDARSAEARIDDELAYFRQVWSLVAARGARLVQVGYDAEGPGAEGYGLSAAPGGRVSLLRAMDAALRAALPESAFFVDLQQISGQLGRRSFYDARTYHWTKQPFSWVGLELLSRHLWAATRALCSGPKKVLVLDLDNTLWGGVVGEEGPLGIRCASGADGEAFRAFQRYCKALSGRGVLLAVCSKNNPADAREVFETNPDMLLRLEDFAAFDASWDPKSVALARIADELRLGLDSFVFMDDNPAERRQVRMALPMVSVIEVPEDAAGFVAAVEDSLFFEAGRITHADRERSEQYQAEARRRVHEERSGSLDDYLESLSMRADLRRIDADDLPRVVQLLGKTNQFNLTTRRHSQADVQALLARPRAVGLSLRLADRFGDYGLIAVVFGVEELDAPEPTLRIDTWLMSCRAIARGVEAYTLNSVAAAARALGYRLLLGEFMPSAKNQLVADLYPKLGFTRLGTTPEGGERYALALTGFEPLKTAVADAAPPA